MIPAVPDKTDQRQTQVHPKQIAAVLALAGAQRYEHFIKVVADWQEVWGLYQDGWALAATDAGQPVFPMWPAKEYAEAAATGTWANYVAKAFPLEELLADLLPKLEKDGLLPGIFYTPGDKGVTPTVSKLRKDIEAELEKY